MDEAYLNSLTDGTFAAESAGLEPGTINPYVVEVMREDNIDLSGKTTQNVFDLYKNGNQNDGVITVCSPEVSKKCPLFPGRILRRNWSFVDPSTAVGLDEEKLDFIRQIRNQIKLQVESFIQDFKERGFRLFIDENDS